MAPAQAPRLCRTLRVFIDCEVGTIDRITGQCSTDASQVALSVRFFDDGTRLASLCDPARPDIALGFVADGETAHSRAFDRIVSWAQSAKAVSVAGCVAVIAGSHALVPTLLDVLM